VPSCESTIDSAFSSNALGGTALTIGEWRGVFAVASALFAFLWKIRVEETRMLKVFPEYQHYRDETWALIPFIF
jgi:protein-S-isoprenylcysteine O-methyltransferase Ste14